MTYTAGTLVDYAWYESKIVARSLETVEGEEFSDGLRLLNEVLAIKAMKPKEIPYYTQTTFNAIPGTELYFIEDLVMPDVLTYVLNSVRFSMRAQGRNKYFGAPRVNNIQTLPGIWNYERVVGGCNLYIYFLPDKAYPFTITGKYMLSNVVANTDLSTLYDESYIAYLKYLLAKKLCEFYSYPVPDSVTINIRDLEEAMKTISPKDYGVQLISTLGKRGYINYAQANIGKGWVPT